MTQCTVHIHLSLNLFTPPPSINKTCSAGDIISTNLLGDIMTNMSHVMAVLRSLGVNAIMGVYNVK